MHKSISNFSCNYKNTHWFSFYSVTTMEIEENEIFETLSRWNMKLWRASSTTLDNTKFNMATLRKISHREGTSLAGSLLHCLVLTKWRLLILKYVTLQADATSHQERKTDHGTAPDVHCGEPTFNSSRKFDYIWTLLPITKPTTLLRQTLPSSHILFLISISRSPRK